MQARSHAEVAAKRFSRKSQSGSLVWRTEFFGPPPSPVTSNSLASAGAVDYQDPQPGEQREPQAFLVEQEPGAVVNPHFHFVDQFQVVAAGYGTLGRHEVAPLSVHFAAGSTGYGPISPGAEGLSYFTFRSAADQSGAQYLPESKERLRPGVRRNVFCDRIVPGTPEQLASRSESAFETVLQEDGGLAVSYLRVPPDQIVQLPDPATGSGMSMLVAAGAVTLQEAEYAAWSCMYVASDDALPELRAGSGGAEILVMRFPRK